MDSFKDQNQINNEHIELKKEENLIINQEEEKKAEQKKQADQKRILDEQNAAKKSTVKKKTLNREEMQKELEHKREAVGRAMREKKMKKPSTRDTLRYRGMLNDEKVWEQIRKDYKGNEPIVTKTVCRIRHGFRHALFEQAIGDSELMENPAFKEIAISFMGLNKMLREPLTDLEETDSISSAYQDALKRMNNYIDAGDSALKGKDKKLFLPGLSLVRELYQVTVAEFENFDDDVNSWKKKGIIPEIISCGEDIVNRKHLSPETEGSGREKMLMDRVYVLSSRRDNGDADSDTMTKVKDAFMVLLEVMNTPIAKKDYQDVDIFTDFKTQAEGVVAAYDEVILHCKEYIKKHKNPHSDDGRERKAMVQELLRSCTEGKRCVPAAAKSFSYYDVPGATWADAYGSDFTTSHVFVPRIVESKTKAIDLNEMAWQQQYDKELKAAHALEAAERERKRQQEERKRQRALFKKRYKPNLNARAYFLKTGIWDPKAKQDAQGENASWYIPKYRTFIEAALAQSDIVTDEEFQEELNKINANMKENFEYIDDPKNMPVIREKFMRKFYFTFKYDKKKGKTHPAYAYEELISLGYPEVDEVIRNYYRRNFSILNAGEKNGIQNQLEAPMEVNDRFKDCIEPLKRMKHQKRALDRMLSLPRRGSNIYKTDAVHYLITNLNETDPEYKEKMQALKTQAEGNDALLLRMVEKKFSPLTRDMAYSGLLKFLGDKALFLNYRQIRDMAESYLRTMAVTDRETMRLERDFNYVYAETVKGPFAERFKDAAIRFIKNVHHGSASYPEAKNSDQRRKMMKKDLEQVNAALEILQGVCKDVDMTRESWDTLLSSFEKLIGEGLHLTGNVKKDAKKQEEKEREGYLACLKTNFEDNKGTDEYIEAYCAEEFKAALKKEIAGRAEKNLKKEIKEETKKALDVYHASLNSETIKDKEAVQKREAEIRENVEKKVRAEKYTQHEQEAVTYYMAHVPGKVKKPIMEKNREEAMRKYLGDLNDTTYKAFKPLGLITPDEFKESIRRRTANSIKKYKKSEKGEKITATEYLTGKRIPKKSTIMADDYSYANILRNHGILENETMKEAVPDDKLRQFLADNLSSILIGNQELMEKFSFMRGIKGIDELDSKLTYGQFDLVANEMLNNIAGEGQQEVLKKALAKGHSLDTKKYLLLAMAKKRTDAEGMDQLIEEIKTKEKRAARLERQRLMIDIGEKYEPRDGKIRFRFEDMPDREKSFISSFFGRGKNWLNGRIERFNQASMVWQELEKAGPEAVEQVKEWMRQVLDTADGDYEMAQKLLKNFSEMISADSAGQKRDKGFYRTSTTSGRVFEISEDIEKKFMKRTAAQGVNQGAVKGQLLESIKKAFGTISDQIDFEGLDDLDIKNKNDVPKEQRKAVKVNSFALEMTMFNAQDIIFGHNGAGQEDFFHYNGKNDSETYNKSILKWAAKVQDSDYVMNQQLSKLEENPELKKEMSDKLLRRYLAVDVKKNNAIDKEIKRCYRHINFHSDNIKAFTLQMATLSKSLSAVMQKAGTGKLSKADQAEFNAIQETIAKAEKDIQHSVNRINHYEGILKTQRATLYKMDSFDKMGKTIEDNIQADGIFSDEVCDTVELYESRKKKFCEYGNGELKTLWNAIVKNDDIFVDLMDPADSVAEKKIAELYKKYATLGLALEKQYEYVGTYYLEDHLGEIFDEKSVEGQRHAQELQDKNEEQQITYWTIELNRFQDKYLSKNKAETKSINENFEKARGGLQKTLGKFFYYTSSSSVDMDMKNQTKMFKKYWFFNSKNYGLDKLVEKNGDSRYMVSMNHAEGFIKGEVELYLHENMDLLQNASSLNALKSYYENEMGPRIIANDQEAERAFLNYVLQHDYHVLPGKRGMFLGDSPDLTDDEMMDGLAQLSAEDQQAIEGRIVTFKEAYRGVMVRNSKEEFRKLIPGLVEEYVTKQSKALEEDESFTDAHRKAAVEREKAMQGERDKVKIQKGYGRMAYNEKLFGGYMDRLKEFGEKKQTICYQANRSKLNKELKSKGERGDDKLFEAAMEKFVRIDGGEPYPDVLAELFDEYVRLSDGYLEKAERALEWLAGNKVMDGEVRRLKLIADCVKKANIPQEWTDFVITYAAKFASHDAPLEKDPITRDIDEVIESAKHGIERITELEAMPVSHPALKLAHRDACQKMRAWMFVEEEKSALNYQKFDEMVENQKAYFAYANLAYEALDEVIKEDDYISQLDGASRSRYENAMHDYFTKRIIDESVAFVNEKKKFDKASYKAAAKKRIENEYARDALVMEKNSVSNEDYENQNVYAGQMTKRDFEKALVMSKHKDLINAYNNLDDDQKQIFVMGLYSSQKDERGSARVIYGQKDEERDAARSQIFAYISGEPVKFEVDYGRAIRAFQSRAKNYHLSADQELFRQAMDFTNMVLQKKEQLRPKDWDRISGDTYSSTLAGDNFRKEIAKEYKNVQENSDIVRDLELNDKASFFAMLGRLQTSDRQREIDQGKFGSLARYYRQKKEGSGIETVVNRVKKMSETQQDMLLYILQDRSMVDFSSGGKNPETGILAHANSEKRFAVFERLMSDEGRFNALSEAASPASITNAMKTLLSYQVRDDKELTAFSLKEEDFVGQSLHRLEALDWELLEHACDFVDEIERERNKKVVLAHATDELETAQYKEGTLDYKRQHFYGQNIRDFTGLKQSQYDEKFKEAMLNAYHDDHKEMKVEGDDLMSAFLALEPQEKALFYRCLENRDILDVSQKNLYKNIFGIAERDFVDVKGRDDLINEYLMASANGNTITVNDDTHAKAFKALCSVQINDDMKFEEMNGDNWVDKNMHVNNQLLVFGRNTMIDWKLFKRALQFVTRAVNERKMAAGDQELYRALGDQSNGEMKFDRRYLRRNLHHTGHRFLRFLGKEGYDTVAPYSGYFSTLAGLSEFVVSKKTANYLHAQANSLYKKVEQEEQYFEPQEEEQKEEEDKKGLFLGNLSSMALNFKEQKETLKQMRGKMREAYDSVNERLGREKAPDKAEMAKERREARRKADDKLDNAMADLVQKREEALDAKEEAEADLHVTGFKCVDLALKYGSALGGTIETLNKYLVENPKYLEMADTYIEKYMGGFMSTKTLGEYYGVAEEWTANKVGFVSNFFIEDSIPDDLEKILQGACNVMETSKEFLGAISEYTNFGAAVFGDFMNIVGSVSNIKKLNAVKKDAKEKEAGDKEKVEGIDFTKYDKELVEFAQGNNSALMYVAGDLTKQAEGRKILATIGDLGVKGAKLAKKLGAADFSKLIGAAFRTADFFWKCFADNKSVYQYYTREGSGILDKLLSGNARLKNTNVGQKLAKEESREYDKDNKTVVTSKEFRLIRNGQGFERDDEIADYLKLNMVHSLLFSSSKFNPLEQPRLLAECTLTILGLSDCIGKTDNETALAIFKKLSA